MNLSYTPSLAELDRAASVVYATMQPTPQYRWPLIDEAAGGPVWLKHENHAPTGAFKVRGGLVYVDALLKGTSSVRGLVTATRGNHGQSVALAARASGLPVAVVVPEGNAAEKNLAIRSLGAELIEAGTDFQESVEHADRLAQERGWHRIPSLHPLLVHGVATWALELFRAAVDIGTLYVPIGLGSGVCGALAARRALGASTEIVGVVAAGAPAYARSLAAGRLVSCPVATALGDGLACRTPHPDALAIIAASGIRLVEVTDAEMASAMRLLFACTHGAAEGAGAAATAALLRDGPRADGRSRAAVVSGANVDTAIFARVLSGWTD